jgi:hypothetical protein
MFMVGNHERLKERSFELWSLKHRIVLRMKISSWYELEKSFDGEKHRYYVVFCFLFFIFNSILSKFVFILLQILYCCNYGFWKGFCLGLLFDIYSWFTLQNINTCIMICWTTIFFKKTNNIILVFSKTFKQTQKELC